MCTHLLHSVLTGSTACATANWESTSDARIRDSQMMSTTRKWLASKSAVLAILAVHGMLQTATSWSTGFGGNPQRTSQVIPTDTFPSSPISRPYEIWRQRTVGQIGSSATLNVEDSRDPLAYITDDIGNIICFRLTSGIFTWVVSTSYPISSSPLVFEDMVYVTTSERLYAIKR